MFLHACVLSKHWHLSPNRKWLFFLSLSALCLLQLHLCPVITVFEDRIPTDIQKTLQFQDRSVCNANVSKAIVTIGDCPQTSSVTDFIVSREGGRTRLNHFDGVFVPTLWSNHKCLIVHRILDVRWLRPLPAELHEKHGVFDDVLLCHIVPNAEEDTQCIDIQNAQRLLSLAFRQSL